MAISTERQTPWAANPIGGVNSHLRERLGLFISPPHLVLICCARADHFIHRLESVKQYRWPCCLAKERYPSADCRFSPFFRHCRFGRYAGRLAQSVHQLLGRSRQLVNQPAVKWRLIFWLTGGLPVRSRIDRPLPCTNAAKIVMVRAGSSRLQKAPALAALRSVWWLVAGFRIALAHIDNHPAALRAGAGHDSRACMCAWHCRTYTFASRKLFPVPNRKKFVYL